MKISKIFNGKLFMYLIFWAVSFYVCLKLFSRTGEFRVIDIIYTFLFHIPLVFAVTIHTVYHLPKFLAKARFWVYGLLLIFLFGATVPLYNLTFNVLSEWLFPGYYLVGMYSQLEVAGFILIYLILSSSLEFSRSWFSTIKAKTRIIELEAEKNASELKALRAQVNPHFLFNSLNTIYNEALKKTDKAPRLILKLSDMLRYVVDKMDHEKVTLEEEIEYLTHFVDLHKERLNNPEKVKFKMEGNFSDAKIAPLLLIIFIENCFKHGDLTDQDARIAISIKFENGELTLICENTMYENEKGSNKITGMGFQNARRRLELAYGGCHNLDISSEGNIFTTKLKMELD